MLVPELIDEDAAVAVPPTLVALNVTSTSSVEAVHGLLLMIQRRVYVVPAVPVNVEVGLEVVVTVPPLPLTMLHAPVPTVAVFAASVT